MSFVVVIPEAERETLRGGGVIPSGFFRDLEGNADGGEGRILLWPHDLDYGAGRVEDGRPVDLAEFFGLGGSANDGERRARERLLAPLLGMPVVHVVFLDERERAGGYARFRSFSEVADWARRLEKALKVRFPREEGILHAPRTLVIVARGQQVKITEEEIGEFGDCVGERRVFRSCYYLDHNLRLGSGDGLYHAPDVWDVVLGRLLLAFLLSQEGDGGNNRPKAYFENPGVKLWRSVDCRAGLSPTSESGAMAEALGTAAVNLREYLEANGEDHVVEAVAPTAEKLREEMDSEVGVLFPKDGKPETWRNRPGGGWSDFKSEECLRQTRDDGGTRWHSAMETVKKAFPGWRRKHRNPRIDEELEKTYEGVHSTVGRLTPEIARLGRRLNESPVPSDPVDNWLAMERAERERRGILGRLEKNTAEFEKARARYVGWGMGSFVFAAVSLALGWIGYRVAAILVPLFGLPGALKMPIALVAFAAMTAGALAAVALVMVCHGRAGTRGMEDLINDSRAADAKLGERDREARTIVAEGMEADAAGRIRARRFRAWLLLTRLQTMVETEMSAHLARGRPSDGRRAAGEGEDAVPEPIRESARDEFLRKTRREFGPFELHNRTEARKVIEKGEAEWRTGTFNAVWRRVSAWDDRNAGHYPARRVIPELRRAVTGYIESMRAHLRAEAVREAGENELLDNVSAWADELTRQSIHLYASASVTGANVTEKTAIPPIVYYNREAIRQELPGTAGTGLYGAQVRKACPGLSDTELLALMFQEFRVEFGRDPETGNLILQVVSDAG